MANSQEYDYFDRPSNETLRIPFTEEMRRYAKRELIHNPDRAENLRLAKESYKRRNKNQEIVIRSYPGANQLLDRFHGIMRRQVIVYSPQNASPEEPFGGTYLTFRYSEKQDKAKLMPEDLYVSFAPGSLKRKGIHNVEPKISAWINDGILCSNRTINRNFALYVFLHPDQFGFKPLDELYDAEYKKHKEYDHIVEQYHISDKNDENLTRVEDSFWEWKDEDLHLIKDIVKNLNILEGYKPAWDEIPQEDVIFIFQNFSIVSIPYIHFPKSKKEGPFSLPSVNTIPQFFLQFLFSLLIIRCGRLGNDKITDIKSTIMAMIPTKSELAKLVEAYCDLKSENQCNPQLTEKIREESNYLSELKQLTLPLEWNNAILGKKSIDNILQKISEYLKPIHLDWLKK